MDKGSDPKAPRRKRVSRACDRCRSKRDKCDGLRPACSACQATGQTCSYDPHVKKRGLPAGYVRGLEKLWALSICYIDGLEDTILTLLGTTTESDGRKQKLMSLWTDDRASEVLHESWKTSRLYSTLENMLSSTHSATESSGKHPQKEGQGSEWRFQLDCSLTALAHDAPPATMATWTAGYPNMTGEPSMNPHQIRAAPGMGDSDYTSTIMGITIPEDGPKDSAVENHDLSIMDGGLFSSLWTDGRHTWRSPRPAAALNTALPQGLRPHPSNPDSGVLSLMMSVTDLGVIHGRFVPLRDNVDTQHSRGPDTIERIKSTGDIDAIFKGLACLDTTEVANNRDTALEDFGYIDNSTFQAFCCNPDRLAGAQPLVHPPSIADIQPPPGFFPEMFRDTVEDGMEG
ncbi:hypothetical protein AbraIFM66951_007995 [Aspergillus brasiliensis]|nr:hypothetical protein AbraIFM66951_007995 [Aspergillus brasiliensis]